MPRLELPRKCRPIFWTQRLHSYTGKKTSPTHHGLAAQSPQHQCIIHATTDLSACNGTPATLGQHNDCPDRDDTERTRPVTTPSVPLSHDLRPPFVPLQHAYAAYDASLTYISDDVVLFWHPPSVFSQWTLSPFTVDLVEYNCAEQFMMASKARLFGDDTERTRPVTTPSVPLSHDLRPPFVPLQHAYATHDASLTYISDDVVFFWHPPSVFSQWTLSPFTVDLVEYNCAEQFMMASKAPLFGDDTAFSVILASNDPREQKRLGRQVRHFDHEL